MKLGRQFLGTIKEDGWNKFTVNIKTRSAEKAGRVLSRWKFQNWLREGSQGGISVSRAKKINQFRWDTGELPNQLLKQKWT